MLDEKRVWLVSPLVVFGNRLSGFSEHGMEAGPHASFLAVFYLFRLGMN